MKLALFIGLGIITVLYLAVLAGAVLRARRALEPGGPRLAPTLLETALGFVTAFFDTLGIGSYAPTTAVFKLRRLVADEKIPGTLNVGHTLATVTQAFIFITIVTVDLRTLVLLIAAACLGSWIGAGFVAQASRLKIQLGMGLALLVAAALFLMKIYEVLPAGGDTQALAGWRLGAGLAGNFILGALMEVGVGLYGPCMILVSLLGLTPIAAFPIMMGSCAFLMPVGTFKFVASGRYDLRATLGLALGGVPAVLLAAFVVKSLPLTAMRWLVVVVVLYAAVSMLRSAFREAKEAKTEPAVAASPVLAE
ncbi:MAG TPA: sulfite exporter TauE/SafE family protein [Thermoanaerobaculia bacterium]|nr:sulfite exporter TauE/SafE family protein [Thermoanaerobaculia bacterium]